MTDLATLGLAVQSGEVVQATTRLKDLAAASRPAEAGVQKVGTASAQAAGGARQLAGAAEAEARALAASTAAAQMNARALEVRGAAAKASVMANRNLIYQLNDVAVSLASGMNPAMVALQQGSQIFQNGIGNALRSMGSLATGVLTKFAPVAAVVGGLAVGFAAMTTEINKTGKAQVSIGDTLVAAWELTSEAIAKAISPISGWFGDMWDKAAPAIVDFGNKLIGVFVGSYDAVKQAWGNLPTFFSALGKQAWNNFLETFEQDALVLKGPWGEWKSGIKFDMTGMKAKPTPAEEAAFGKTEVTWGDAMSRDYIRDDLGPRAREVASRPTDKAIKKAQKEAERQAQAYDKITRSAQQRIDQAQLEAQSLGMTAEAISRARHEQELFNQAANDNIDLSPKQRTQLTALAASMAAAEEATRRMVEAYNFGKDVFGGFFSDLKSNLSDGMGLWSSFGDAAAAALGKIADKVLGMATDGIFDIIFGALKGTLFGGGMDSIGPGASFGQLSGFLQNAKGNVFNSPSLSAYSNGVYNSPQMFAFAKGGGVFAEAGPEAIMPLRRGPDGKLGVSASNGNSPAAGNDNRSINLVVNVNGATGNEEIKRMAAQGAGEVLMQYRRTQLQDDVLYTTKNDMRRGGFRSVGVAAPLVRR